jgi:hypothetical protein
MSDHSGYLTASQKVIEQSAEIARLTRERDAARKALHKIKRTCEMSAGIMRDTARTGGWDGAERVAMQFDRLADRACAALSPSESPLP